MSSGTWTVWQKNSEGNVHLKCIIVTEVTHAFTQSGPPLLEVKCCCASSNDIVEAAVLARSR